MPFDPTVLAHKEAELAQVAARLKKDFIGVDAVINQFIKQVTPWFTFPEILDRPTVINLWGMTGVGKTDLVRKFVQYIDFQNRFLELELSNSRQSAYADYSASVASILHKNQLFDERPSILFFDEIQHFRTIDESGKEITDRKFQDFWELLSDGQLVKRDAVEELEELMLELLYEQESNKSRSGEEREHSPIIQRPWMARRLKKILQTSENNIDTESLLTMTPTEALVELRQSKRSKHIYQTNRFSQALIIIGGNLDSLYRMSELTSESEVDATIFHEQTKKLSIIDVKNALQERFRPEQISRLGNTHIIYPSLHTANFIELIRARLAKVTESVQAHTGVSCEFTDAVVALIYANGVFPTQGVRPVFSAVSEIITSQLSSWVLTAAKQNATSCRIDYDQQQSTFKISFPDTEIQPLTQTYTASLDAVRSGKLQDEQALVAVHEAGHAVAYAVLFGLAPIQIKSKLASANRNGFTFPHRIELTKENLSLQLQILAAGSLAEELCFGHQHISSGHSSDLERATMLASNAIRKFAFSELQGTFTSIFQSNAVEQRTDLEQTNPLVEKLLLSAQKQCRVLLTEHFAFLQAVSRDLLHTGLLEPEQFVALAQQHTVTCTTKPESWLIIEAYERKLAGQNHPTEPLCND